MIESFRSRMQVELLDRKRWKSRVEIGSARCDDIEIFGNRLCLHSALGTMPPVKSETRRTQTTAAGIRSVDSTKSRTVQSLHESRGASRTLDGGRNFCAVCSHVSMVREQVRSMIAGLRQLPTLMPSCLSGPEWFPRPIVPECRSSRQAGSGGTPPKAL